MWHRFSRPAQHVVEQATYFAKRSGNPAVEPEHLFVALLREVDSVVVGALESIGIPAAELAHVVEATWEESITPPPDPRDALFSSDTRAALEDSVIAAGRLQHNYIGTHHILLGVLYRTPGPSDELKQLIMAF